MRLGRANVVEVAFGKQPNISMKQPIPVVLLFENGMSAAVPAEDFSLIIFASFLLYRPKRQVFSSVRRSQGADCWRSRAVSLFASPRVGLASDKLAVADFSLPRITIQSNMIAAAKQCPLTACSGVFLQALAQRQQEQTKKDLL